MLVNNELAKQTELSQLCDSTVRIADIVVTNKELPV